MFDWTTPLSLVSLLADVEEANRFAPPDTFDWVVTIGFVVFVSLAIIAGIFFSLVDLQACYRAWRKVLIVMRDYLPSIPRWAKHRTPHCLLVFNLKLPCTQTQLLQAYRQLVKTMHPDVGGDLQQFMKLQSEFEQAKLFLHELEQEQTEDNELVA